MQLPNWGMGTVFENWANVGDICFEHYRRVPRVKHSKINPHLDIALCTIKAICIKLETTVNNSTKISNRINQR